MKVTDCVVCSVDDTRMKNKEVTGVKGCRGDAFGGKMIPYFHTVPHKPTASLSKPQNPQTPARDQREDKKSNNKQQLKTRQNLSPAN